MKILKSAYLYSLFLVVLLITSCGERAEQAQTESKVAVSAPEQIISIE